MTGSDEYPLTIGKNVLIKGKSYLLGSRIGDNVTIEHSVLKQKKIKNGGDVSFYLPETEGTENISEIPEAGGVKKRRMRKR
jgi:bifunctional UDP-N-acetylglucosamine pyrophosphorylase/glucosamine-1-phosphate N-acetyltransferase